MTPYCDLSALEIVRSINFLLHYLRLQWEQLLTLLYAYREMITVQM